MVCLPARTERYVRAGSAGTRETRASARIICVSLRDNNSQLRDDYFKTQRFASGSLKQTIQVRDLRGLYLPVRCRHPLRKKESFCPC